MLTYSYLHADSVGIATSEPQVIPDSGDTIAVNSEDLDLTASPPAVDADIDLDNVMARPADSTVSDDEAGFEATEDVKVESNNGGTRKKEKDFLRECVVVNGTKFSLDLVSLICYGKYRHYLRGEQHIDGVVLHVVVIKPHVNLLHCIGS